MVKERKENAYAYSYHTNYIRNARAIAIAWGIFTFCFAIIMIILFVEPSWMYGATQGVGTFGLWQFCEDTSSSFQTTCDNDIWRESATPNSPAFPGQTRQIKAAAWLILFAVILVGLSILCMLLFLCKKPTTRIVFMIAGSLQIACGVLLFLGVILYAAGKRNPDDRGRAFLVCGEDGTNCTFGWAFILAIVAILDAIALGVLAFILAIKQEKLDLDPSYSDYSRPNGSTSGRDYGTVNSSIFKTHSRNSLNSASKQRKGSITDSRRSTGSGESVADVATESVNGYRSDPTYASVTPKSERKSFNGDATSMGSQGSRGRTGTPKSGRRSNSPHDVVL